MSLLRTATPLAAAAVRSSTRASAARCFSTSLVRDKDVKNVTV